MSSDEIQFIATMMESDFDPESGDVVDQVGRFTRSDRVGYLACSAVLWMA